MAKFKLEKGDRIIARPSAAREEYTGRILFIPEPYEKSLEVTRVFHHGVRTRERGYIHNNCIISKVENENDRKEIHM